MSTLANLASRILPTGYENCSPARLNALLEQHFSPEEQREAAELIEDLLCRDDPLYWAQTWTRTENPHWQKQGLPFVAPFPKKSYFEHLFAAFQKHRLLLIPKSRDMLTSWSVMVWATALAQWKNGFCVVQTMKEDKAKELVAYADCLWRHQELWLRRLHPLAGQSATEITWRDGGRVLGVPAGEHQIRTYHPTLYIMDEAAFLPEAEACWNVALASSPHIQMIGVSSASPGWMANECAV